MRSVYVVSALGLCLMAAPPWALGQRAVGDTHRNIAVLVGVERYESPEVEFPLRGCQNDVRAMGRVLLDGFGFMGLPSRREGPIMLIDSDATKQTIMSVLRKVAREARPGDQIVFYFSGYGSLGRDGAPSLCPYDALRDDPRNDILLRELYQWVNRDLKGKCDNVALILDCCFAAAPQGEGLRVRPKYLERAGVEQADPTDVESKLRNLVHKRGVLLCACKPGEVARESEERSGWKGKGLTVASKGLTLPSKGLTVPSKGVSTSNWMGVFSRFLVERLEGLERSAKVSYEALAAQIETDVRTYVHCNWYESPCPQTPMCLGQQNYTARALFSPERLTRPPSSPFADSTFVVRMREEGPPVRLRVVYYGTRPEWSAQVRRQIGSKLMHVRLVDSEETADQALLVLDSERNDSLRGYYLINSKGDVVGERFTADPEDDDLETFLDELNERIKDLVFYRFAAALPTTDSGLGLESLQIVNKDNEPVDCLRVGEDYSIVVQPKRDCYIMLSAACVGTKDPEYLWPDDHRQLKGKETTRLDYTPDDPGQYQLIAVTTDREDIDYTQIIKQYWEKSLEQQKAYRKGLTVASKGVTVPSKGVTIPSKGVTLPSKGVTIPSKGPEEEGIGILPVLPELPAPPWARQGGGKGFGKVTLKQDEKVSYAIRVLPVTVVK